MAGGKKADKKKAGISDYSRRDFLAGSGAVLAACTPVAAAIPPASPAPAKTDYPPSKGYLVYDGKKCAGCTTCMLACSLTHEGVQSITLSRIQIIQDSFGKFPNDVIMAPCRQCVTPVCVERCPVGAVYVDADNGNIRRIDSEKCIGCQTCLSACPQQPHRPVWNHLKKKSMKCDLCLDTPYWKEPGGMNGKQACVESCPMKAIKLVTKTPNQKETEGYNVNLRNVHWLNLGLVDSSTVEPPAVAEQPKTLFSVPKPEPETKE
ncbi:MAG: 4Fe-4S dicluster domain-containing protein [Acidobacteriota bacterium]